MPSCLLDWCVFPNIESLNQANRPLKQTTFSWLIPLIPILPFKRLKDASYGLQRVFKYAQTRVDAFLNEEKPSPGTLLEAYLENGKPKPPYSAWYIALSGHGFM
ncbi:uncharacterized protein AUP68_00758 [Ilyonectria robusta]